MHRRFSLQSIFIELMVAFFVLLFLYTAINKLSDRNSFIEAMEKNPVVASYATILSWAVPLVELIIVVLLFIPVYRRMGLLAGSILMTVFTIFVAYMLQTQSSLPCTCGGVLEQMSWRSHLKFNLITTIAGFMSYIFYPKILSRPTGEAEHLQHSRQH